MAHLTDFSGNISFYHFGSAGNSEDDVASAGNSEDDVAHVELCHAVWAAGGLAGIMESVIIGVSFVVRLFFEK